MEASVNSEMAYSSIRSDEGQTLETLTFQIFDGGNSTFIHSFDKTKFLCFTLLPTQNQTFFRNRKFLQNNKESSFSVKKLRLCGRKTRNERVDRCQISDRKARALQSQQTAFANAYELILLKNFWMDVLLITSLRNSVLSLKYRKSHDTRSRMPYCRPPILCASCKKYTFENLC